MLSDWLYGMSWDQWASQDRASRAMRSASAGPRRPGAAVMPPWDPPRLMTILLRRHLRLVTAGPIVVVPPNELRGIRFGTHVYFHPLWAAGDDLTTVAQNIAHAFLNEGRRAADSKKERH